MAVSSGDLRYLFFYLVIKSWVRILVLLVEFEYCSVMHVVKVNY